MLRSLTIQNYALIEQMELQLHPGLSIVTGETGAGKSIMLGALGLLCGDRADLKAVRDKSRKMVVEASFSTDGKDSLLNAMCAEMDYEPGDELILRRELTTSGKSRAFVNDSPVNLKLLGDISSRLIDIHSQNQNLLLSNPHYRLQVLDTFADDGEVLEEYRLQFKKYVALRNKLNSLKTALETNRRDYDYLSFQLSQLEKLAPKEGEIKELEREFDLLSDASEIKEHLDMASGLLNAEDGQSVLANMAGVRDVLRKVNFSLFPQSESTTDLMPRVESLLIELADVSREVENLSSQVEANPQRLETVEKRMDQLYSATRNFNLKHADELCAYRNELAAKLKDLDTGDERVKELEERVKAEGKNLRSVADKLSEVRAANAEKLSALILETARPLGMENLNFAVVMARTKMTADGQDEVSFMCSFNKNQELVPMENTASGGEMSRLMLSIKSVMASKLGLPTMVFDEIDTGVSGEIADRMGKMMQHMAENIQVLAISHLPQVASKGKHHYKIYKSDDDLSTRTNAIELNEEQRVTELAMMLSGEKINDAALENARVLLNQSSHNSSNES